MLLYQMLPWAVPTDCNLLVLPVPVKVYVNNCWKRYFLRYHCLIDNNSVVLKRVFTLFHNGNTNMVHPSKTLNQNYMVSNSLALAWRGVVKPYS